MTKNGMMRILTTLQAVYPKYYENRSKDQKSDMADTWTSFFVLWFLSGSGSSRFGEGSYKVGSDREGVEMAAH